MTGRTSWWGGWGVVLVVVVGAGCGGGGGAADALKLVPGDVTAAAVVDVARIRTSKPWKLAEEEMRAGASTATPEGARAADVLKRLEDFKTATGVDPSQDVDLIVVGLASAGVGLPGYIMVVKGKNFDEARLADYLSKTAKTPVDKVDMRGTAAYRLSSTAMAAVIDSGTLLVGSPDFVKRSIDLAKDGGKSAADAEPLQAVLKRHDAAAGAWLGVVIGPDLQPMVARLPVAGLAGAKSAAVSLVLDPEVRVLVDAELATAGDATAARDALAGMIKEYRPLLGTFVPVAGDLLDAVVLVVEVDRLIATVILTDGLIADIRSFVRERAGSFLGGAGGAMAAPTGTSAPATAAPASGTAAP